MYICGDLTYILRLFSAANFENCRLRLCSDSNASNVAEIAFG